MTHEYCIRMVNLPHGVHGCVAEDCDGFYNVYINLRDSIETQKEALDHEVKKHIEGNDFAKHDVHEIEGL